MSMVKFFSAFLIILLSSKSVAMADQFYAERSGMDIYSKEVDGKILWDILANYTVKNSEYKGGIKINGFGYRAYTGKDTFKINEFCPEDTSNRDTVCFSINRIRYNIDGEKDRFDKYLEQQSLTKLNQLGWFCGFIVTNFDEFILWSKETAANPEYITDKDLAPKLVDFFVAGQSEYEIFGRNCLSAVINAKSGKKEQVAKGTDTNQSLAKSEKIWDLQTKVNELSETLKTTERSLQKLRDYSATQLKKMRAEAYELQRKNDRLQNKVSQLEATAENLRTDNKKLQNSAINGDKPESAPLTDSEQICSNWMTEDFWAQSQEKQLECISKVENINKIKSGKNILGAAVKFATSHQVINKILDQNLNPNARESKHGFLNIYRKALRDGFPPKTVSRIIENFESSEQNDMYRDKRLLEYFLSLSAETMLSALESTDVVEVESVFFRALEAQLNLAMLTDDGFKNLAYRLGQGNKDTIEFFLVYSKDIFVRNFPKENYDEFLSSISYGVIAEALSSKDDSIMVNFYSKMGSLQKFGSKQPYNWVFSGPTGDASPYLQFMLIIEKIHKPNIRNSVEVLNYFKSTNASAEISYERYGTTIINLLQFTALIESKPQLQIVLANWFIYNLDIDVLEYTEDGWNVTDLARKSGASSVFRTFIMNSWRAKSLEPKIKDLENKLSEVLLIVETLGTTNQNLLQAQDTLQKKYDALLLASEINAQEEYDALQKKYDALLLASEINAKEESETSRPRKTLPSCIEIEYVYLVTGYRSARSFFNDFKGKDVCFTDFFKRPQKFSGDKTILNFSGVIECWQDRNSQSSLKPQTYRVTGKVKGLSYDGRVLELGNCSFESN